MSEKKRKMLLEKDVFNAEDCSKFTVPSLRDWNSDKVCKFYYYVALLLKAVLKYLFAGA